MLTPGTIIDQKYSVVEEIGGGGFGHVYRAVQIGFDRQVAIKVLNRAALEAQEATRFEREARTMSALKHRGIVGFYGYGIHAGAPYMVLEMLEGTALDKVLARDKQMHPERALHIFHQVLEALQAAHAAGVVHRDLKPSNIMLVKHPERDDRDLVKIIDFGLARLMPAYGTPGQKLTDTGFTLGTAHYMPPEQALGAPVDEHADIYSAGCILYQMLAGRLPFDANDNVAIMYMHINDDAVPVEKFIAPDATPHAVALGNFVRNCMAKLPEERYQSAEEALQELSRLESPRPTSVAPRAVSSGRTGNARRSKPPRALGKALLAGGAVLAAICAAAMITSNNQHEETILDGYRAQISGFEGNPGLLTPQNLDQFMQIARMDQQHQAISDTERLYLNTRLCEYFAGEYTRHNRPTDRDRAIEFAKNVIPVAQVAANAGSERDSIQCGLLLRCGSKLEDLHATADSVRLYESLLPINNCNFRPRICLANIYIKEKQYDKAIAVVTPNLQNPDYPGGAYLTHIELANIYVIRGQLDKADQEYHSALDYPYGSGHQAAYSGFARIAYLRGDYRKCIQFADLSEGEFLRAEQLRTKRVGSDFLVGERRAYEWGAHNPSSVLLIAAAKARTGHLDEAKRLLRDFDPNSVASQYESLPIKEFDDALIQSALATSSKPSSIRE